MACDWWHGEDCCADELQDEIREQRGIIDRQSLVIDWLLDQLGEERAKNVRPLVEMSISDHIEEVERAALFHLQWE